MIGRRLGTGNRSVDGRGGRIAGHVGVRIAAGRLRTIVRSIAWSTAEKIGAQHREPVGMPARQLFQIFLTARATIHMPGEIRHQIGVELLVQEQQEILGRRAAFPRHGDDSLANAMSSDTRRRDSRDRTS